jgi:hypothetical protein
MQAGGGSLKWFRDVLGGSETFSANISGLDAYDLLSQQAAKVPCGYDPYKGPPRAVGT